MFRGRNSLLDWLPRDGDDVEVNAIVSLYEARGEFQLNIESMRRAGLGRLYEEFLRLKQRLTAEGLFDQPRRPLPQMTRRVGVVTSLQAAAATLSALQRRARTADRRHPVPVQGTGAELRSAMLARVCARRSRRVVLLVRGGGPIEDLWRFNEGCRTRDRALRCRSWSVSVTKLHDRRSCCRRTRTHTDGCGGIGGTVGTAPARRLVAAAAWHVSRRRDCRLPPSASITQRRLATPRGLHRSRHASVACSPCRDAAARLRGVGVAVFVAGPLAARPQPDMEKCLPVATGRGVQAVNNQRTRAAADAAGGSAERARSGGGTQSGLCDGTRRVWARGDEFERPRDR
jgi:hypothetical protein